MPPPTPHRVDPPNTAMPRCVGPNTAGLAVRQTIGRRTEPAALGAGVESDANQLLRPEASVTTSGNQAFSSAHSRGPLDSDDVSRSDGSTDLASREDWLRLHATDLLDRLQAWASDLDAREAQLNARLSVQDHRERRFRLHQQDVATELAEQKRSIERLRAENKAQARRLAFQGDSTVE